MLFINIDSMAGTVGVPNTNVAEVVGERVSGARVQKKCAGRCSRYVREWLMGNIAVLLKKMP